MREIERGRVRERESECLPEQILRDKLAHFHEVVDSVSPLRLSGRTTETNQMCVGFMRHDF